MSLADKITLLRILLIPVFIVLMYVGAPVYAAIVLIIAALTDVLDGYIARKSNTVSDFGRVFDPIADKILVMSAIVVFASQNLLPAWLVIVFISRELIISGYRILVSSKGCKVVAASVLGKIKTITQDIFIVLIILKPFIGFISLFYLDDIFIYTSLVFALWSMVDYIVKYNKVRQADNEG